MKNLRLNESEIEALRVESLADVPASAICSLALRFVAQKEKAFARWLKTQSVETRAAQIQRAAKARGEQLKGQPALIKRNG